MLLRIEHVSVRFGGIVAVNDSNFTVKENEITCLIGPNGAGKTTLFNLITGFLTPTTGSIHFRDQNITGMKPEKIVRLGIARTFQNLRLFNDMTVLENMLLAVPGKYNQSILRPLFLRPRLKKIEAGNIERALETLEYVGLGGKAGEIVDNLSYAEQKLLTIGRLLMTEADVLLLDEPASGLDKNSLDRIMPLVQDLKRQNKTILLIEHNMDIIRSIADQVVFLNQGQVLGVGTAEEIMSNPALTEIYFGGGAHHGEGA
jgi:ABC-type branched-subunit amino acid transport system ATPase component